MVRVPRFSREDRGRRASAGAEGLAGGRCPSLQEPGGPRWASLWAAAVRALVSPRAADFLGAVDALDAGYLHPVDDEDSLRRFLLWVNCWSPERKRELRSLHALLTEKFPACPQIWSILEFPPTG